MTEALVSKENLSTDLLRSILESALIDFSVDDDGDLIVTDTVTVYMFPNRTSKEMISLIAQWGFKDGVPDSARNHCALQITAEYQLLRAVITTNRSLRISYDIFVAGGMTQKNVALTLKRFCSACVAAVSEHTDLIG